MIEDTVNSSKQVPHLPVLLDAVLKHLAVPEGGIIIDGTVGAGGHSAAMLEEAGSNGQLLGIDQDQSALAIAKERLAPYGSRVRLIHAKFDSIAEQFALTGWDAPDTVLLDIGVSSMHLDQAERGFSFRQDGPLDMRMNPDGDDPTAAEIVNTYPQQELSDLIFQYGEDKQSRRIARHIVEARPIETTKALADVIAGAIPRKLWGKIHPATRTFQALRIAVNDELGVLERVIPEAIGLLKPGGRLGIITFHSLEDRIVKRAFKLASTDCICPPEQPVCTCDHRAIVRKITRKPAMAFPAEIDANPRSRSAKLRVVEKC